MKQSEYKITEAWNFASHAHLSQKYMHQATGLPYITHIGNVVHEIFLFLLDSKKDYDIELLIIGAILHDVLEDTLHTYDEINNLFGQVIADTVLALTKDSTISSSQVKMMDSLNRILQQPKEAAIIKMADRISNLQAPPSHWDLKKIKSYFDESLILFDKLMPADDLMATRLLKKIEFYKKYL